MKRTKKFRLFCLLGGLVLVWGLHSVFSESEFLVKNFGLVFSLKTSNMLFLNIIFVFILGWWYWKSNFWSLGLIWIGGMTNLIDRFYFGYVRDYWDLGFGIVNNLNDWLIGVGVLLFLIELWRKSK